MGDEDSKVLTPPQASKLWEGVWLYLVFAVVCLSTPMHLPAPVQAGHSLPDATPGPPILDRRVSCEDGQLPLGFCLTVTIYTPL